MRIEIWNLKPGDYISICTSQFYVHVKKEHMQYYPEKKKHIFLVQVVKGPYEVNCYAYGKIIDYKSLEIEWKLETLEGTYIGESYFNDALNDWIPASDILERIPDEN